MISLPIKINKDEYLNYMKYVDEAKDVNFQSNNLLQIHDFIQTQNQTFRKIKIDLKMFEKQKKTWFWKFWCCLQSG